MFDHGHFFSVKDEKHRLDMKDMNTCNQELIIKSF